MREQAQRHADEMGMQLLSVSAGSAVVSMRVRDDMINGWGVCHGGLIASLADTAFATACNSHGAVTVASGFDIDFLEPVHEGDVLVATATERLLRGRSGIYDATVRCGERVVAEFRGRSRALRRSDQAARS